MRQIILPSKTEAEVKEITGVEETILEDAIQAKYPDADSRFVAACTLSLGGKKSPSLNDILNLHSGDRLRLLIEIRRESLGDIVEDSFLCEDKECKARSFFRVDLADVEDLPLELEGNVPLSNGRNAHYTFPSGASELMMKQSLRSQQNAKGQQNMKKKMSVFNAIMLSRKVTLEGVLATEEALNALSLRDREEIIERMMRPVGGPDTKIEQECEKCGRSWTGRVEGLPAFLFPKRAGLVA